MFAVIEASVNIERVIVFVIERHLAEELYVLCGNGRFYLAARSVKVFFRLKVQRSLCVLLKSLVAARHVREPEARIVVYEVEHHLFVIAANDYDALRVSKLQLHHVRDDTGRVRPTINQIAKEDKRVGILVVRQHA